MLTFINRFLASQIGEMAWASTLSDTPQASISSSCDQRVCDLNKLVYRFNAETPWRYFRDGVPLASSVERGRKKRDLKLKKIYTRKRKKINARKNRPYKDTEAMSLLCSCDKGCLMRRPAHECRRMIQDLRAAFYQKSYNEQNYVLLGLMEVRVCPTGRRTITYKVPTLGTVCRGAFQICYGFSRRKLQVLLKKLEVDGVSIQQDMRGRHGNNAMRLLPEARRAVTDFICSKRATESHYRRSRTQKRYFDCRTSMRKMWREFVKVNPNLKTNRSKLKNKGPVISFSTFRNIFNEDLGDLLSFRKARIDTCQYCDEIQNKLHIIRLEVKNGNFSNVNELERLQNEHNAHCLESERRFACMKYDMVILSKKN